ncbi:hypothetical protein D7U77_17330, partial [Stenotrophomonas maltophilia]|nr:hypothetical protein [Stenotrophomonas maltophilia]
FETRVVSVHVSLGVGSDVQLPGVTSRTGLRRLPPPDPPRHPQVSQLLLLLRLRPLQVQGAALHEKPTPLPR